MKFQIIILVGFICTFNVLQAQHKDTSFVPETLDKEDLNKFEKQKGKYKFSLDALDTDPRDVIENYYVVTKYDIFQYDCVTLVDVLKIVPGFRVSQPGNAQLGEMFAVNGLVGNVNMTVMINGLPINPSGLPGIPIGAQLPIKQAERIEIIVGPSVMFGTVSMAGVINIVIAEVERPVEVNASVSMGDNRLRSINTLMSGKTGKGKNLLAYSLYGSFRNRDYTLRDLDTSQFVLNPDLLDNPYYVVSSFDSKFSEIASLPNNSYLIGGNIRFRGFTMTGDIMTRNAHAALGASPEKISYSDRNTVIDEVSYLIGLDYKSNPEKVLGVHLKSSFLFYEMDRNSSYIGVNHSISNGRNYLYANSFSVNFEPIITFKRKKTAMILGGQIRSENSVNNQNFMQSPYNLFASTNNEGVVGFINSTDSLSSISEFSKFYTNINLFRTVYFKARYRLKNMMSVMSFQYQKENIFSGLLNANIGIGYDFFDNLNLRGSFTRISQYPSTYFQNNNFISRSVINGPDEVRFEQEFISLFEETMNRFDLTLNFYWRENTKFSARLYRQVLSNGLSNLIDVPDNPLQPDNNDFFIGYTNNSGQSVLNGLQLSSITRGTSTNSTLDLLFRFGSEDIDNIASINSYRGVPRFSIYYTLSSDYKGSRNQTGISFRYESAFIDHARWQNGAAYLPETRRSFNLDWSHNIAFGKNLYLKLKILNLLKTRNYGIYYNWLNTNTLDYTPQIERIFSFGLKYRLN